MNRAWLCVGLLCVVGCLNYLDRMMLATMRNSLKADIAMTDADFGLLSSVFLWVYGLLSPFMGYFADRFSRSRVIIVSLLVWSVVTGLTAFATTFEQLLVTRALMGVSEACYIPAALALIADYHRGSTRSLATGLHMAGVMAGQSLGFVGGWLAEQYHWTLAFQIMGLLGVVYGGILLFLLKDAPRPAETATKEPDNVSFGSGLRTIFRSRAYWLALVFWSLLAVVGWLVIGWLPTYYKDQFGLSQTLAGVYATAYLYPASMVGVLAGGFWADRWSRTNPRARILVPVVGLAIGAPFIFLAGSTSVLGLAIGFFVLYAFCRAFTDANMMPILCLFVDARYRATAYGVLNLFSCLVGGVAIYAGGYLRDAQVSLSLIYQFAGLVMVVAAFTLFWVKDRSL
jgi:MFS family permease